MVKGQNLIGKRTEVDQKENWVLFQIYWHGERKNIWVPVLLIHFLVQFGLFKNGYLWKHPYRTKFEVDFGDKRPLMHKSQSKPTEKFGVFKSQIEPNTDELGTVSAVCSPQCGWNVLQLNPHSWSHSFIKPKYVLFKNNKE